MVITTICTTQMIDGAPKQLKDQFERSSDKAMRSIVHCTDFDRLKKKLNNLIIDYNKADALQIHLPKSIIKDYLTGNIVFWEKQLLISMGIINSLDEGNLKWIDENVSIIYGTNTTLKQVKNDAVGLLDYLNAGNSLSNLPPSLKQLFLPKEMRQKLYVVHKVSVNGNLCNTKNRLELVVQDITLREGFWELSQIWEPEATLGGLYGHRYAFFKKLILNVIDLIAIIEEAEKTRLEIQKMSNIQIIPFEEKCIVIQGGKKIQPPKEMDSSNHEAIEYSFADIIQQLDDKIVNL